MIRRKKKHSCQGCVDAQTRLRKETNVVQRGYKNVWKNSIDCTHKTAHFVKCIFLVRFNEKQTSREWPREEVFIKIFFRWKQDKQHYQLPQNNARGVYYRTALLTTSKLQVLSVAKSAGPCHKYPPPSTQMFLHPLTTHRACLKRFLSSIYIIPLRKPDAFIYNSYYHRYMRQNMYLLLCHVLGIAAFRMR